MMTAEKWLILFCWLDKWIPRAIDAACIFWAVVFSYKSEFDKTNFWILILILRRQLRGGK